MFSLRRVKYDQRDAADLADLLRMGRLPEAWIAPPATRELRGWVRHRAKLVGLRSNLKCQIHAVLAGAGVQVSMGDLFGVAGQDLLASMRLTSESRARVDSALRVITGLDFEVELFGRLVAGRLRTDPGVVTGSPRFMTKSPETNDVDAGLAEEAAVDVEQGLIDDLARAAQDASTAPITAMGNGEATSATTSKPSRSRRLH
jgi:hypothetical protein